MPIEVRQMVIRSSVDTEPSRTKEQDDCCLPMDERQQAQLKDEILAECKTWLMRWLDDERER